jgi:hypothetical protein
MAHRAWYIYHTSAFCCCSFDVFTRWCAILKGTRNPSYLIRNWFHSSKIVRNWLGNGSIFQGPVHFDISWQPAIFRHFEENANKCQNFVELATKGKGGFSWCWFITRLTCFCDDSITGQSMRAGGATTVAEAGVSPHIIQATGRWASETFQIYSRKSPVLIQALIWAKPPSATSV